LFCQLLGILVLTLLDILPGLFCQLLGILPAQLSV